jgi:hypothetical protein
MYCACTSGNRESKSRRNLPKLSVRQITVAGRGARTGGAVGLLCLGIFCGLAPVIGGCHRRPPDSQARLAASMTSPKAVYEQLRQWHAEGSYLNMQPWIDPAGSDELIDLLVAMDEFQTANATAQVALARACPEIDPREFDTPWLENSLGLFSRDAEYVGEEIHGDRATVIIDVRGREKPLEFERRGSRWMYMPGACDPRLTAFVASLARSLTQIATTFSGGPCPPAKVASEYRYRVASKIDQMRRSLAAPSTQPGTLGMNAPRR